MIEMHSGPASALRNECPATALPDVCGAIRVAVANLWDGTFPTDTQVFRDHPARVDLEVGLLTASTTCWVDK